MTKYRQLLTALTDPNSRDAARKALVEEASKSVRHLIKQLQHSPDPLIREVSAEMLGECGLARAIPALISALTDESLFVRQDALWAIGKLCRFQPGALETILSLSNNDAPGKLHTRVSAWWRANRKFIEKSMVW